MTNPDSVDFARLSRQCWGMLEPLHVVSYLTPGPYEAYAKLDLHGRDAYFASRSAPLGRASAELVTATFYVFSPSLIAHGVPSCWDKVTPEQIIDVRYQAVADALRAALGDVDLSEPLTLVREASAGLTAHGRPLYASYAALDWPEDPFKALFHASALIREHRGDAHMSALFQNGLDPVEALITGGLAMNNLDFVRATRGWTDDEWAAGESRLRARNLLTDDGQSLTPDGAELRAQVEAQTDAHATEGWEHLGAQDSLRFRELMRPLREKIFETGLLPAWIRGRG